MKSLQWLKLYHYLVAVELSLLDEFSGVVPTAYFLGSKSCHLAGQLLQ
jgi:hypothetical protein